MTPQIAARHERRRRIAQRMRGCMNPFGVLNQLEDEWNAALELAASLVCPEPQVEEERECSEVAALIRQHKYDRPEASEKETP